MKNYIRFIVLALLATANAMSAFAQKPEPPNGQREESREQLAESTAKYIAYELAFDQATTTKFIKTYCDFHEELWSLGPLPKFKKSESEEQSKEIIESNFEHSQKILDLRRKYYNEYSKFLTQKQIERVYQLEKNVMKRFGAPDKKGPGKPQANKKRPPHKRRQPQRCPSQPCPADSLAPAAPVAYIQG